MQAQQLQPYHTNVINIGDVGRQHESMWGSERTRTQKYWKAVICCGKKISVYVICQAVYDHFDITIQDINHWWKNSRILKICEYIRINILIYTDMVGLVRGVEVISGENFNSPLDCSKRSLLTGWRGGRGWCGWRIRRSSASVEIVWMVCRLVG